MSGGQFDWGGRLLKSNGGARRSAQPELKPGVECKRISGLDCEANTPSPKSMLSGKRCGKAQTARRLA